MDTLRTVYVSGLPEAKDEDIVRALRILGVQKWTKLREKDGALNGFLEFSSAAQIKISADILAKVAIQDHMIRLVMDNKTAQWIASTASNATAQTVTRMTPESLLGRVSTALAVLKNTVPLDDASKTSDTAEDGTLDSSNEFNEDEKAMARQSIQEFKKQLVLDRARTQQTKDAYLQKIAEKHSNTIIQDPMVVDLLEFEKDFNNFDGSALAQNGAQEDDEKLWSSTVLKLDKLRNKYLATLKSLVISDEDKKKAYDRYMSFVDTGVRTTTPSALERRQKEKDADKLDAEKEAEEVSRVSDVPHAGEVPAASEDPVISETPDIPQSSGTVNWEKVTPEWIQAELHPKVEELVIEYFGIPEQSIIEFIEKHVAARNDRESLAGELKETLDEDTDEFIEKLWSILP